MKQYRWPLLFAIILNLALIAFIVFSNMPNTLKVTKQPKVLKIHLESANKPRSIQAISNNDQQWLKQHYGQTLSVVKAFKAGDDLKGYLVALKANPKQKSIIYSVNNGQYYLLGSVFDKKNANISILNANKYIKTPRAKDIYLAASKLKGIYQGIASAPQVTIVIDPNSNLFRGQWQDLGYDIANGMFSVKWILVNYLKPMGPNVAASILQAKNKIDALAYNADHYNAVSQTGGYHKPVALTRNIRDNLRTNWSFIQKYNLYHLPLVILKHNGHVYVLQGAVSDETLEAILGGA